MKTNNWFDFYKDRMNDKYRKHIETKYADFIYFIMNNLPDKEVVSLHEAGCGAGNISRVLFNKLKKEGRNFTLSMSDKSEDMLKLAQSNIPFPAKTVIDSVYGQFNRCHVIFAHGLLEHFDNDNIKAMIANQLKWADRVIHYVPSNKYEKPSFGDERLMSKEEWQQICNPTKIVEFNDGYDLILMWDIEKIETPEFIVQYGPGYEKFIEKASSDEVDRTKYGYLTIGKANKFFLDKKEILGYPHPDHVWAKFYRHPTESEILLYGNT